MWGSSRFQLTFAVGVLDAEMMYASWISCLAALEMLKCLETCARRWLEALTWEVAKRADMVTGWLCSGTMVWILPARRKGQHLGYIADAEDEEIDAEEKEEKKRKIRSNQVKELE